MYGLFAIKEIEKPAQAGKSGIQEIGEYTCDSILVACDLSYMSTSTIRSNTL
jgi:hypothetical protein